jgi:uncharacterized protein YqeY
MDTPTVGARLRQALSEALKARDTIAVSALRSALGAIDNASAVPVTDGTGGADGPIGAARTSSPHFAGAAAGLGAGETGRRALSEADARAIVRAEVAERETAAHEYERAGRVDRAGRLRREADVLASAVAVET